ncbi:thioredoxin [bacterium (Candidatus Blackallbacteria) CG17_big_fil_post_rev_8_21_14_2_50_48_46]|uniref:Thioredoxin n=1 Tax=bacterium (Candidatus Blackallbacteria) CG17_big_fil_post_rev_8_21_14_2_50_48_46 TaxID=2014261 RepID=A0A2M7G9A1_9BACT|nr:MAG: thioredoxin [bacterium (Candidatus Blackallbacteria) CG18_big_fil_WC_8_21_14_2_50_49_26]PIW18683.1 MAG: thioredoxin [bacterium (Candidatus Blackallbacteria) CG17_big_fil_post_rev_8_21_14_2_50_48_46]PIW46331.1 MAG: thioredoxin [bacterium (Candidatus Blackallbacteria) CG13_big_fil_rev_8_21_14_2_50_49_14]
MSAQTKPSFESLISESPVPILVDFWAEWCGPCKMMNPVLKQVAKQYEGKLKIIKINVDQNPAAANFYGIQSIPTLMLFWKGKPIMDLKGAMPYEQLQHQIDLRLERL